MVRDWLNKDVPDQYFFLKEFLKMRHINSLRPYSTMVLGVTLCDNDPYVFKVALESSIDRLKRKLLKGQDISNEYLSLLLSDSLIDHPTNIQRVANVLGSVQENFLDKINMTFFELLINNHRIKNDSVLASRLMAMCLRIIEASDKLDNAPKKASKFVVQANQLGPLVFCSPELGRWSTVGGLGVMVNELSIGLAELG